MAPTVIILPPNTPTSSGGGESPVSQTPPLPSSNATSSSAATANASDLTGAENPVLAAPKPVENETPAASRDFVMELSHYSLAFTMDGRLSGPQKQDYFAVNDITDHYLRQIVLDEISNDMDFVTVIHKAFIEVDGGVVIEFKSKALFAEEPLLKPKLLEDVIAQAFATGQVLEYLQKLEMELPDSNPFSFTLQVQYLHDEEEYEEQPGSSSTKGEASGSTAGIAAGAAALGLLVAGAGIYRLKKDGSLENLFGSDGDSEDKDELIGKSIGNEPSSEETITFHGSDHTFSYHDRTIDSVEKGGNISPLEKRSKLNPTNWNVRRTIARRTAPTQSTVMTNLTTDVSSVKPTEPSASQQTETIDEGSDCASHSSTSSSLSEELLPPPEIKKTSAFSLSAFDLLAPARVSVEFSPKDDSSQEGGDGDEGESDGSNENQITEKSSLISPSPDSDEVSVPKLSFRERTRKLREEKRIFEERLQKERLAGAKALEEQQETIRSEATIVSKQMDQSKARAKLAEEKVQQAKERSMMEQQKLQEAEDELAMRLREQEELSKCEQQRLQQARASFEARLQAEGNTRRLEQHRLAELKAKIQEAENLAEEDAKQARLRIASERQKLAKAKREIDSKLFTEAENEVARQELLEQKAQLEQERREVENKAKADVEKAKQAVEEATKQRKAAERRLAKERRVFEQQMSQEEQRLREQERDRMILEERLETQRQAAQNAKEEALEAVRQAELDRLAEEEKLQKARQSLEFRVQQEQDLRKRQERRISSARMSFQEHVEEEEQAIYESHFRKPTEPRRIKPRSKVHYDEDPWWTLSNESSSHQKGHDESQDQR